MTPPSGDWEKATSLVARLVEAGYPAYFVGGAVRDRIMGRPLSDVDIATAATPDVVASLFETTVPVGASFGVVLVIQDGKSYQVATFRSEGPYRDGRRPEWVRFADEREDVLRRDFTINGMLYDPLEGRLHDWVGGREDIARRVIRTIGEPHQRFAEDKLRMLRAVRLAAQLRFDIEEETGRAVQEMAPEILAVSAERIRDELVKTLTSLAPGRGLVLLDRYRLLEPVLPEIAAMKGVEQGREEHPEGDVYAHTVKILSLLCEPSAALALSALLHDVGKPPTHSPAGPVLFPGHARAGAEMAREILTRLRFDRDTRERVAEAVAEHLRFFDAPRMRRSTLRRFLAGDHFAEKLALHRFDCLAGGGDLSKWLFLLERRDDLEREAIPPEPLLRGRDLLALGFRPGPPIGRILREVEEQRLEGNLRTREEAVRWVAERYRPGGSGG